MNKALSEDYNWKFVGAFTFILIVGIISLVGYVINLQGKIVSATALQSAKFYADALSDVRAVYTSEVVNRVRYHKDINVQHDYLQREYAIPLPASFSRLLGEKMGAHDGARMKLYSAYPFPWRTEDGGLNDDFRRKAWESLNTNPDEPYYQFTEYNGVPALRYATADVMQSSCINCHNTHPDSPKKDWRVNDVRGVLEIIHPTQLVTSQSEISRSGLYAWTVIIVLFGVICLVFIILQFRGLTERLETKVNDRTKDLKKAEISLRESMEFNIRLLDTVQSIIIGVDTNDSINYWNSFAEEYFHLKKEDVIGKQILNTGLKWDWLTICKKILDCIAAEAYSDRFEIDYTDNYCGARVLSLSIAPMLTDENNLKGYLIIAEDITEQKSEQNKQYQMEKLQSIGQLSAGIAHEINTPVQYIGDNTHFLQESFEEVNDIVNSSRTLVERLGDKQDIKQFQKDMEQLYDEHDIEFILEDVPKAIEQTLDGVNRVSTIVKAMKDFSHPGSSGKDKTDINRTIDSTITVSRNVWKYVADLETEFDPEMGEISCFTGPFNEVILNMIVNSAHAIEAHPEKNSEEKGSIKITTKRHKQYGEIRVQDSGHGISKKIQEKVFDPFFTTKEVGKGTGQGLSLSHSIIVDQHGGELFFESKEGKGTTFVIRLPIDQRESA